jgi:hypothetical protein
MNPRVKSVEPTKDYLLKIVFNNDEKKLFDIKPYLDFGLFSELKDLALFQTAKAELGTVIWNNGLDICPDTLYLESKKFD